LVGSIYDPGSLKADQLKQKCCKNGNLFI